MSKNYPTQEYLKECLDYDPENGDFTWKKRPYSHFSSVRGFKIWNSRFPETRAGSTSTSGGKKHLKIGICGRTFLAHRLVFIIINGDINDELCVDHIDGNGLNNRLSNLRTVTAKDNQRNQRRNSANSSGCTGVCWSKKSKKWQAQIRIGGTQVHLGIFSSLDAAVKARKEAEKKYGYHKNHGSDRPL